MLGQFAYEYLAPNKVKSMSICTYITIINLYNYMNYNFLSILIFSIFSIEAAHGAGAQTCDCKRDRLLVHSSK